MLLRRGISWLLAPVVLLAAITATVAPAATAAPAASRLAAVATGSAASVPADPPNTLGCYGRCPYAHAIVIGQRAGGVLRNPEAIAIGPAGDIYVADQFTYAIQRFTPQGRFVDDWGSFGDGDGQFGAVNGLAVGPTGDVYAVDSMHDRIEVFTPSGRFLFAFGRGGSAPGEFNFGGSGGPSGPPGGDIAIREGRVYVADTHNYRVQVFTLQGTHPRVWNSPGGLRHRYEPRGIAVGQAGVYVADGANRSVELFDPAGRLLAHEGSFGRGPGQFADPYGIAVDGAGDVFVADDNNNRIVELDAHLRYVGSWTGTGAAKLSYVRAVAADAADHVFVADTGDNRIEVFDADGAALLRFGVGAAPHPTELTEPAAVATSPTGDVFVVAPFGQSAPIFVFGPTFHPIALWLGGGAELGRNYYAPTAASAASDGTLWTTDIGNNVIRHLSARGVLLGAFRGAAGADPPTFSGPEGVALNGVGDVYVADTRNNRIVKLSPAGSLLAVWGASRGGRPGLEHPSAIAVAPTTGDVYVTEAAHDLIVQLSPEGTVLAEWGRSGRALLHAPEGIAVDEHGDVFVADSDNNRIVEYDASGQPLTLWGTQGTAPGQFDHPAGLAIDCNGDLLVADTRNDRLQAFTGIAAGPGCVRGG